MTVMGDALGDRLSDAGSIPARSTGNKESLATLRALADCEAIYFDSSRMLRACDTRSAPTETECRPHCLHKVLF